MCLVFVPHSRHLSLSLPLCPFLPLSIRRLTALSPPLVSLSLTPPPISVPPSVYSTVNCVFLHLCLASSYVLSSSLCSSGSPSLRLSANTPPPPLHPSLRFVSLSLSPPPFHLRLTISFNPRPLFLYLFFSLYLRSFIPPPHRAFLPLCPSTSPSLISPSVLFFLRLSIFHSNSAPSSFHSSLLSFHPYVCLFVSLSLLFYVPSPSVPPPLFLISFTKVLSQIRPCIEVVISL